MCAKTKSDKLNPKSVREKGAPQQLGIANGWRQIPDLIQKCNHRVTKKTLGNCYHEYYCEICNYVYTVDSSD